MEKKWLPGLIYPAGAVLYKNDIVWGIRLNTKLHIKLIEAQVPFSVVAGKTCRDEILPGVIPSLRFRHDMVNCKGKVAPAAVGAFMTVPAEYVLS